MSSEQLAGLGQGSGYGGAPRGCPCKGGTPPGAPWAERLALSLPALSTALFCDYYNPKGHCEWHYQPCGAPCLRTCRNPRGQYLHDVCGLEGALLPCWSGRGRAGETVVGAKVCPGDPGTLGQAGWLLTPRGAFAAIASSSPRRGGAQGWGLSRGGAEAVGSWCGWDSGLSGPQAATPSAHQRPPSSMRTRCDV